MVFPCFPRLLLWKDAAQKLELDLTNVSKLRSDIYQSIAFYRQGETLKAQEYFLENISTQLDELADFSDQLTAASDQHMKLRSAVIEKIQKQILFAIMFLGSIIIIMTFSLNVRFGNKIASRLRLLTDGAQKIADTGELDQKIEIGEQDELGGFAAAFNKMADDLKKSRAAAMQSEKMSAIG